jgi:hypothetical protein
MSQPPEIKKKSCIKRVYEANKALLKKCDIFAIGKASAEDGSLDYGSAIGGVFALIFIAGALTIILYYFISYFQTPAITVNQQISNYQTYDFLTIDDANKKMINDTLKINASVNSANFDFGIFFPDLYNTTLDVLLNQGVYMPQEAFSSGLDATCHQPYYFSLSHFSAIITVDTFNANTTNITVPMQFLSEISYQGQQGRLYVPYVLENFTLGLNFQVEIVMELAKSSSTTSFVNDFSPVNATSKLSHVYFLYREYGYDSKNIKPTTSLNAWVFNYYPPGTTGVDIGSCNQVWISAGTIEVLVSQGFFTTTTTTLFKKFSGWKSTSYSYLNADMYGVCPINDTTPFSNGTQPTQGSNCQNPAAFYQPFKVTITGNKVQSTYNVEYAGGLALLSLIGGAVTALMSIIGGFAGFYNKKFYKQEILDEIRENINHGKLKDMEYEDLDPIQKSVFLNYLDKNRMRKAQENIDKLRKRQWESDMLLLEEIDMHTKPDDEKMDLLDNSAGTLSDKFFPAGGRGGSSSPQSERGRLAVKRTQVSPETALLVKEAN